MGHFKSGKPLLLQVLDIECIMDKYERRSGKKLDDDFKASIFLRSISGNMQNHLATILTEDVTYDVLCEAALRFKRINAKWDARSLLQSNSMFSKSRVSDQALVPMEIDAVQTKGKGKGKGKQQKGAKARKARANSRKVANPRKARANSTKVQAGPAAREQGSKQGQPGSGKGAQGVICHVCHKRGHYAGDCWHAVRQVRQCGPIECPDNSRAFRVSSSPA